MIICIQGCLLTDLTPSVRMVFTKLVQQQGCARVMVYGMLVYLSACLPDQGGQDGKHLLYLVPNYCLKHAYWSAVT